MSDIALTLDPDIISKSEFARRRNVKPPRVTQWIEAKKIHGAALVGEGRHAKIRESLACAQLNRTLDVSQRLGNGLATRLTVAPGTACSASAESQRPLDLPIGDLETRPSSPSPAVPSTHDMIAQQKLIQLSRANERSLIEDAVSRGRLVDAQVVKALVGREVGRLISAFEGSLTGFANAVAAEFKLPQRDVLHVLRAAFRQARAASSTQAATRAASLPRTAEIDFDADIPSASQPDEDEHSDEFS